MNISKLMTFAAFAVTNLAFATPAITNVTAEQHYPWDGKVDITYTVTDIATMAKEQGLITSLKVTATDGETSLTYTASTLNGETSLEDGTHSIVWDMRAQGLTFGSTNVVFSVTCETTPAAYCVIDLSAGAEVSSYPVSYLAEPPSGGFNVDAYKTTKLVLKRIEAGTFIMGEDQTDEYHRVTLTKPFFLGLFEVTQKQWSLVTESNPSKFSGDKLPVENVSYNAIRGSLEGAKWPASNAVDSSSFLGKFRARTGLDFDLPTEAQWEYACRAGTTTTYSYGNTANGNYMWYTSNSSSQTHEVGTKQPNPWGLYDMHGNVWEWCLDWYGTLSYGTDPKGSSSGSSRVWRGGRWDGSASNCTSSQRNNSGGPGHAIWGTTGFRLARAFLTASQAISYSDISVPTTIGRPDSPVISPAGCVVAAWPVSVTISCATDGATIHYTTDGSEPTEDSPVYRRFRITERTTVKAVAIKNGVVSEVAVAEYASGQCADPVITGPSSFTGSETKVSLSCATPGATIRYTLNGNDPNSHATRYTGPFYVADSCTVKAYATCYDYLDSAVATQAIEKVWGIGDTVGAPDHTFATDGDLPFVRVTDNTAPLGESMKSGAITHSQTSTLSTTVMGPGTISFQWKTSCEKDPDDFFEWDHAEFWVDGTRIVRLDGESGWQTFSHAIADNKSSHTLEWRYVKDNVESEGDDCCWVADYHWSSAYTATQTTPAPVPYVWLRGHFPHTPDEYDAYESAAKEDAANGVNKVWECYVAGISPTNSAARFEARIDFVDGSPVVKWSPDLNEGGTKHERVYTVEGKVNLTDSWAPTNAASRFFRVKVSMP